ncbi:uncharacterized protein HaLaN_04336, partial [Haematococcus lacustris]
WAETYAEASPVLCALRAWPLSPAAPVAWPQTDPTEEDSEKEVVSADWLERLKAAPAAAVERAKKFCTSGKLKEVAYESLDGVTTLLDAVGPFLPPPGNTAASLLSGLCKCVHGAHVNNTNLEMLRDRCLDLLDLVLQLGHTDAFISTSRDSSKPPKLFKGFTRIMNRAGWAGWHAYEQEANAYCENYTKAGILAGLSRFFFHAGHKEDYEELITELRDLRVSEWPQAVKQLQPPFLLLPFLLLQWTTWWLQDDATFTLGVYLKELLEEVVYKLNAGMPSVGGANERIQASLEKIQARLAEDIPFKMDEKLEEYMARQNVRGYSILLHQPHLKALWSKHFMHKQAVRWGMWWTVFPGELALDDTLNEAAKQQDSKDAFRRAVELEDTIYISIDELCLSFPDDSPLLPTVQALLCKGIDLMCEDKDRTELAIAEAGRGQKKLEEKLTAMEAELKKEMSYSNFSQHIHQNNMQKLWSVYFKHEQAVRWGLWWAVFPAKLEGLPATSKQEVGFFPPWHSVLCLATHNPCCAHDPAMMPTSLPSLAYTTSQSTPFIAHVGSASLHCLQLRHRPRLPMASLPSPPAAINLPLHSTCLPASGRFAA